MKAFSVALAIVIIITPLASATTYQIITYRDTDMDYTKEASLQAGQRDEYVFREYEGSTVYLNISSDSRMLLDVRDPNGSFIYRSINGTYNTSFTVGSESSFYVYLTASDPVNYTIHLSSEHRVERSTLEEYADYTAMVLCTISVVIVFAFIGLMIGIRRANRREKKNRYGEDPPYRVK